jgi:hypothetical protein
MLDLHQPVLGEDFQIINPVEARLAHGDAQEFVVGGVFIAHMQDAKQPDHDMTAGERGLLDEDQDIKRIPIGGPRTRNEALISRVMDRGEEDPI